MAKTKTKTQGEYAEQLRQFCGGKVRPLGKYIDCRVAIRHECLVCKYIWKIRPMTLIRNRTGHGCPECGKAAMRHNQPNRKSHADYVKEVKRRHGNKFTILSTYTKWDCQIKVKCNLCKNRWSTQANGLRQGSGCPNCAKRKVTGTHFLRHRHNVTMNGKKHAVAGKEPQAIEVLRQEFGAKALALPGDKRIPIIQMKNGRYCPDIFIPKRNLIIEVKGLATSGLAPFFPNHLTPSQVFYKMQSKIVAAMEAGYKVRLMVFDHKDHVLKLPRGWTILPFREFRKSVHQLNSL